MTNIITDAINAVGSSGADWRVQAGAAVLLIVTGAGLMFVENIRPHWPRKGKTK